MRRGRFVPLSRLDAYIAKTLRETKPMRKSIVSRVPEMAAKKLAASAKKTVVKSRKTKFRPRVYVLRTGGEGLILRAADDIRDFGLTESDDGVEVWACELVKKGILSVSVQPVITMRTAKDD